MTTGVVVSLLERPLYGYGEVDRLLRLTPGTAKRWINGYERLGRSYPPVVREERTDSRWVTWGEFVETRLLSEYRSSVPMLKLRPAVEMLRERLDRKYPLSYGRPFLLAEGRDLLLDVQRETGLDKELWLVVPSGQEVMLTATSRRFTGAATYAPDDSVPRLGEAYSLHADPGTPEVVFDPRFRQGQPTVKNIPTETLSELVEAGESVGFVAGVYGFDVDEVEQAVAYEASRRRRAS